MGSRARLLIPFALVGGIGALAPSAAAVEMEHRITLRGRGLSEVARSVRHSAFFPAHSKEAISYLSTIAAALERWYGKQSESARSAGRFAFPSSTPWSPARLPCPIGSPKLSPESPAWKHASWRALGFAPSEAHRFQYRVVSVGRGAEASFSIQARGDNDCNGRRSLYRLSGHARGGALVFPLLRVRHAHE